MSVLSVFIAIALPLLLGSAIVMSILPGFRFMALKLSASIVVGWLMVAIVSGVCLTLTGSSKTLPLCLVALSSAVFSGIAFLRNRARTDVQPIPRMTLSPGEKALIVCAVSVIFLRYFSVAIDGWSRPMFGADTLGFWGLQAKQSFLAGAWLPEYENRGYVPPVVPGLLIWMALVTGVFDETIVLAAWPFFYAAAALATFGFVNWGAGGKARLWIALISAYLTLSLPLVNSHVALGGYADLILATEFGLVLFCLQVALREQHLGFGLVGGLVGLSLPFTKKWGWVLCVIVLVSLLLEFFLSQSRQKIFRRLVLGLLIVTAGAIAILFFGGIQISHYRLDYSMFNPDIRVFIDSMLTLDNYHLAFAGFVIAHIFGMATLRSTKLRFVWSSTTAFFLLTVFAFSLDIGQYRLEGAVLNRTLMVWAIATIGLCGFLVAENLDVTDRAARSLVNTSSVSAGS